MSESGRASMGNHHTQVSANARAKNLTTRRFSRVSPAAYERLQLDPTDDSPLAVDTDGGVAHDAATTDRDPVPTTRRTATVPPLRHDRPMLLGLLMSPCRTPMIMTEWTAVPAGGHGSCLRPVYSMGWARCELF